MDVKGVAPLHVKVPARMFQQVLVANKPVAEKAKMALSGGWKLDKNK